MTRPLDDYDQQRNSQRQLDEDRSWEKDQSREPHSRRQLIPVTREDRAERTPLTVGAAFVAEKGGE